MSHNHPPLYGSFVLGGIYISVIHLVFFYKTVHETCTPPIEQSDWSEFTSHGTNLLMHGSHDK